MKNRKTYIIADFVKILDIPRTTLKDWLSRYEPYIDFEVRGHRKIYFDSSLEVLKEIVELRDEGRTPSEIMMELAERHPVDAELNDDFPVQAGGHFTIDKNIPLEKIIPAIKQQIDRLECMIIEKLRETATELHEAQLAALLPVLKRQQEKMERVLHMKFHDVATNAHSTHLDANKLTKQNSRRLLLVIALGFTIVIAVILSSSKIYYSLLDQQENLRIAEQNIKENISQNKNLFIDELQKRLAAEKEQKLKFQKLSAIIEDNNKNTRQDIGEFKSELSSQQNVFKKMLDKYNKTMLEQRKEEIKLLKDNFGKEREDLLKQITELKKQNKQNKVSKENYSEELTDLKKTIYDLQKSMEILRKEKKEAETAMLNYRLQEKVREEDKSPEIK